MNHPVYYRDGQAKLSLNFKAFRGCSERENHFISSRKKCIMQMEPINEQLNLSIKTGLLHQGARLNNYGNTFINIK